MKKFRFTMGTLILAMMATTFMACNKDKETTVMPQRTAAIDMSNLAIFYNGERMDSYFESDYVPTRQADMELVSIADTTSIYYFDQNSLFRTFCSEHQMETIYENNAKLDSIYQKAIELGLVDNEFDGETIPQDMLDYWQSVFGNDMETMAESNRALVNKLYDGYWCNGDSKTFFCRLRPTLGSMDNRTSSFTMYVGLGATVFCYNRWFGGQRRYIWYAGNQPISFSLYQNIDNNKYSSYFCIGL